MCSNDLSMPHDFHGVIIRQYSEAQTTKSQLQIMSNKNLNLTNVKSRLL